jgi:hypothetical protein
MTKKELSRVTDKETREAWGRKWAGVAGSAPCKDAALKSANRNKFHWSAEASALFQDAVTELGGLSLANRKSICDLSDSPARTPSPPNLSSGSKLGPLHHLTYLQVQSRLQKVRQQARAATSQLQTHAVAPAAPAPKKPSTYVAGGWTAEYESSQCAPLWPQSWGPVLADAVGMPVDSPWKAWIRWVSAVTLASSHEGCHREDQGHAGKVL